MLLLKWKVLKEQEVLKIKKNRIFNQNGLDEACFQHDMAYGDLNRRTAAHKVLCDKTFNITKIQNVVDINGHLLQ